MTPGCRRDGQRLRLPAETARPAVGTPPRALRPGRRRAACPAPAPARTRPAAAPAPHLLSVRPRGRVARPAHPARGAGRGRSPRRRGAPPTGGMALRMCVPQLPRKARKAPQLLLLHLRHVQRRRVSLACRCAYVWQNGLGRVRRTSPPAPHLAPAKLRPRAGAAKAVHGRSTTRKRLSRSRFARGQRTLGGREAVVDGGWAATLPRWIRAATGETMAQKRRPERHRSSRSRGKYHWPRLSAQRILEPKV